MKTLKPRLNKTPRRLFLAGAIATLVLASLLFGAATRPRDNEKAETLLQRAIQKQVSDGDLDGAILLYRKVIAAPDVTRAVASTALARLGQCLEWLDGGEAQKVYQQILEDFPERSETVDVARARLAALGAAKRSNNPALVPLSDGLDPQHISSNGRWLAGFDARGNLVVRNLFSGQKQNLTSISLDEIVAAPLLSPPARQRVAYLSRSLNELKIGLRVVDLEGEKASRTFVDLTEYVDVVPGGWSPDGSRILVTALRRDGDCELAWVDLQGGRPQALLTLGRRCFARRASVSPDGRYAVFEALATAPPPTSPGVKLPPVDSLPRHIYVIPTDGRGQATSIVKGENVNESPLWIDASHVLFVSNRSGGGFRLFSVEVRNGQPAGTAAPFMGVNGRVSPVATTISGSFYYIPERSPGSGNDVFVVDFDRASGSARLPRRRLSNNSIDWNRAPAWSADGKFVAFKRRRPGAENVFDTIVLNLETGEEKSYATRASVPVSAAPPVWFHGSEAVLTQAVMNGNPAMLLYRVDLKTANFQSIAERAHRRLPAGWQSAAVSRDDRELFLAVRDPATGAGQIATFNVDTGDQKFIFNAPASEITGLALSPDGGALAMIMRANGSDHAALIRIGADGSDPQTLDSSIVPGSRLTWSKPDGRTLFYVAEHQGVTQIMQIPASGGGRPTPIGVTIRDPLGLHAMDFSPNGSIVFSDSTRSNELWGIDYVAALLGDGNQ
jgi:Tol biopolymer transport system component